MCEDADTLLFLSPRTLDFYRINTVQVMWNRLLEQLGLDDETKYRKKKIHKRRLYTLRKFFRTNLEAAGVPYRAVEALLGHKNWYVRFAKEQLKK